MCYYITLPINMRQIITLLKAHIRTNIFDQMTISRLQVVAPTKKCLRKSLQRTGAMATFLKRNYRPKNHEYRSYWTIWCFFSRRCPTSVIIAQLTYTGGFRIGPDGFVTLYWCFFRIVGISDISSLEPYIGAF